MSWWEPLRSANKALTSKASTAKRSICYSCLFHLWNRPGDHLRALENISRQLRDDSFCRFLKQAKTSKDIDVLLDEADNNQFGG